MYIYNKLHNTVVQAPFHNPKHLTVFRIRLFNTDDQTDYNWINHTTPINHSNQVGHADCMPLIKKENSF